MKSERYRPAITSSSVLIDVADMSTMTAITNMPGVDG
jgi:hypothetical protein